MKEEDLSLAWTIQMMDAVINVLYIDWIFSG